MIRKNGKMLISSDAIGNSNVDCCRGVDKKELSDSDSDIVAGQE